MGKEESCEDSAGQALQGQKAGHKDLPMGSGEGPDCELLVEPVAIIKMIGGLEGQTNLVGKCGNFLLMKINVPSVNHVR